MLPSFLIVILIPIKCDDCSEFGPNCVSCENGACTRCTTSYGIDTNIESENHGKCVPCKYYGYNFGSCKQCNDNYEICTECNLEFGFDLDEKSPFYQKCRRCDQSLCLDCHDNYSRCYNCNYIDGLSGFIPGTVINHKYGICAPCEWPCKTCNMMINNQCFTCVDGYKNEDYKCQKCSDANCENCKYGLDKCDNCRIGYGFDSYGSCKKCEDDGCSTCFDNYKVCDSCRYKYGIDNDVDSETYGKCIRCQVEKCENCEKDASKCFQYSGSYYKDEDKYSPTYGELVLCSQNCKTCKENDNCILCISRDYGLNNGKCQKCLDPNCIDCRDDYSICSICKDGFGADNDPNSVNYGKCIKCEENCKSCYSNDFRLCRVCQPGLGRNEEGKCVKCHDEHCIQCSDKDYCKLCEEGYVSVTSVHACVKSELKNCAISSLYADRCIECQENYTLTDSQCVANNLYPHCKSYYIQDESVYCSECEDGFGFDLSNTQKLYQSCLKCSDENCENCLNDKNDCILCKSPYYLNKSSKECVLNCNVTNCNICSNEDNTKCTKCKDGYMLNYDNQCEKCISNCKTCPYRTSSCNECFKGYSSIYTGECIECSIPHCSYCYKKNICHYCKDGYYLNNGKCKKCALEGCRCYDNSTDFCDFCLSGYGLDHRKGTSNYNKCVRCSLENCAKCDGDPTICTLCTNKEEPENDYCPHYLDENTDDDDDNYNDDDDEEPDSDEDKIGSSFDDIEDIVSNEDKNIEDESNSSKKKVPVAAIIGGIVGGVAVIGIIGGLIYYFSKKKKKQVSASP